MLAKRLWILVQPFISGTFNGDVISTHYYVQATRWRREHVSGTTVTMRMCSTLLPNTTLVTQARRVHVGLFTRSVSCKLLTTVLYPNWCSVFIAFLCKHVTFDVSTKDAQGNSPGQKYDCKHNKVLGMRLGKKYRFHFQGSDLWKMGPMGCRDKSVHNYQSTPRKIPEKRGSLLHCGGRLKSRDD